MNDSLFRSMWTYPSLAVRSLSRVSVFMREARLVAGTFLLVFAGLSEVHAFTQVNLSTAAPAQVEETFLEWTTTYFQATRIDNPLAANTHTIELFGIQQNPPLLGSSASDTLAEGFGDGLDSGRVTTLKQIQALQALDISSCTCAGLTVSTEAYQSCQALYHVIGNAIAGQWNTVYSSTGAVVAP